MTFKQSKVISTLSNERKNRRIASECYAGHGGETGTLSTCLGYEQTFTHLKRNYMVFANCETAFPILFRHLSILGMGIGSSSVRLAILSCDYERLLEATVFSSVNDANNLLCRILGLVSLVAVMGTSLVKPKFFVWRRLAAPKSSVSAKTANKTGRTRVCWRNAQLRSHHFARVSMGLTRSSGTKIRGKSEILRRLLRTKCNEFFRYLCYAWNGWTLRLSRKRYCDHNIAMQLQVLVKNRGRRRCSENDIHMS